VDSTTLDLRARWFGCQNALAHTSRSNSCGAASIQLKSPATDPQWCSGFAHAAKGKAKGDDRSYENMSPVHGVLAIDQAILKERFSRI
jgi:hypothetical protein